MAKKKKKTKKSSGPKPLLSKKKLRKLVFRIILLGLGIGVGIMLRPSVIKDPVKRAQVEDFRTQVLDANDQAQEKALEVLGASSESLKETVETVSDVAEKVTHEDPEEVVNDTVTSLKSEVESLPEKQIKKIKLQFCQDVIEEIEISCEEK